MMANAMDHPGELSDGAGQARLWPLDFSPEIETLYRAHVVEQNHRQVAIAWLIGLCLYDSFIISDYIVAEHYIDLFLITRFLVVTPICLLAAVCIWRKSPHYDAWASVFPIVMTIALSALIFVTEGDFRVHYMFGNILLMMCNCVIGRPRTKYIIAAVSLQSLVYILVLYTADFVSDANKMVSILFCLSGAVMSILTAYALEKFNRGSFILGLCIQRLNRELEAQSLTDPLTKLANKRSFEQATTRYWRDRLSRSQPVSFVLIDIDRFKLFNDSYGHLAGDMCLTRIAGCIAAGVPEGNGLAVRFGGEEVILFLPSTGFAKAREIAEKIRLSILKEAIPHPAIGLNEVVSASFGVATATPETCELSELVVRADSALYAAKKNGRNQVWPPLMDEAKETTLVSPSTWGLSQQRHAQALEDYPRPVMAATG